MMNEKMKCKSNTFYEVQKPAKRYSRLICRVHSVDPRSLLVGIAWVHSYADFFSIDDLKKLADEPQNLRQMT